MNSPKRYANVPWANETACMIGVPLKFSSCTALSHFLHPSLLQSPSISPAISISTQNIHVPVHVVQCFVCMSVIQQITCTLCIFIVYLKSYKSAFPFKLKSCQPLRYTLQPYQWLDSSECPCVLLSLSVSLTHTHRVRSHRARSESLCTCSLCKTSKHECWINNPT